MQTTLIKKTLLCTGAAFLALSTAASAATLSILGGTLGVIPEGGQQNEILENVFGFLPTDTLSSGSFGSQIAIDVDANITASFWGYEAGARNSFVMNGATTFQTTNGVNSAYAVDSATPIASQTISVVAGLLDFSFTTNLFGTTSAVNGSNPLNIPSGDTNFYSYMALDGSVFLFFDDTGGGDDDNHDDFVVSLSFGPTTGGPTPTPVPLPAGGLLLIGGLGALAAARRRKNKS